MSLTKIFFEYVTADYGKGFKSHDYFKFILLKKSTKWIEKQIADNLINPQKLKSNNNKIISTHGSQYIIMNYDDKKMIMRLSTHEPKEMHGSKSNYTINAWNNNEKYIKDHINNFIDYCIVYFNSIEKETKGEGLTDYEKNIKRKIESNIYLYNDTNYPNLSDVHRKAIKKQKNNTRTDTIDLP